MNTRRKLLLFGKRDASVGLLNTTEGAGAAFAISLRMLNADLIGQDAIEVHRVSDSATMFFQLTASGVDTAAIASYCGASDGVVGWMLDQSGNGRHAQQTALASAPKIYDGASQSIITENGKPAFGLDGSQYFNISTGLDLAQDVSDLSLFNTVKINDYGNSDVVINIETGSGVARAIVSSPTNKEIRTGGRRLDSDSFDFVALDSAGVPNHIIITSLFDYTNADLYQYINSANEVSTTSFQTPGRTQDTPSTSITLFGDGSGNNIGGTAQESIIYQTNRAAQRATIETDIMNYYGIS